MNNKLSLIIFLICLIGINVACINTTKKVEKKKRPNILIIETDDQGYADLSAYAHSAADIETPQMDRIAQDGILFTQAYATASVCSPSRVGWMTGLYQQRWDTKMAWAPGLPDTVKTIIEYMHEAGYITGKVGKSDLGKGYHQADVREHPSNHGYDHFFGFSAHAHDFFLLSKEIEENTPDPYGHSAALGQLFKNKEKVDIKEGYTTTLFTDDAISFVEENKEKPFFLTLSYNSVHHLIHEVPNSYLKKHGVAPIPTYDPKTMGKYEDYYNTYNQLDPISDEDMRKYYLANLNCLDDNIGRLLDKLEELGIDDNTLIIFFADNGGSPLTGANNRPLRGAKYGLYEGGIRVPFAVKWPKYYNKDNAGTVYDYPISLLDIFPTCIEASNTNIPEERFLDGESFLKQVKEGKISTSKNKPYVWQFQKGYAVRVGDWKLIENHAADTRPMTSQILDGPDDGKLALYNLANDIGEQSNVIEQNPEVAQRLKGVYQQWLKEMKTAQSQNVAIQ